MSFRICKCCGEPIAEQGDTFFCNPNLCSSCSSLSRGKPESSMSSFAEFDDEVLVEADFHPVAADPVKAFARR
jgi:hypothetical protein